MPGTGSGEEGSAVTRQRVAAAVGCPKSNVSRGFFQRRITSAIVPELSAASLSRREAVIDSLAISPTTLPSPPWRKPSSQQASAVFSSPASTMMMRSGSSPA